MPKCQSKGLSIGLLHDKFNKTSILKVLQNPQTLRVETRCWVSGWWFGTWLLWLSHHIGNFIIPTDKVHHFSVQRDRAQPPFQPDPLIQELGIPPGKIGYNGNIMGKIWGSIPSGNNSYTLRTWSHGPVEIVDSASYKMVDLSIVFCKRLPEGTLHGNGVSAETCGWINNRFLGLILAPSVGGWIVWPWLLGCSLWLLEAIGEWWSY